MQSIKSIVTASAFILIAHQLNAQNWLWAEGFTNSGCHRDGGNYITWHSNNNIYCTGSYGASCTIIADDDSIGGGGNVNSYFTSFNQGGSFLNITSAAAFYTPPNNTYVSFAGKPAVDDSGYMYNALEVTGSGIIDSINVSGTSTYVLSKWDTADRCLWVKPFTSLYNVVYYNNNLYGIGSYKQSSVQIDTINLFDPENKTQGYLTRLDKQGNCKWARQATGGNTKFSYVQAGNNCIYACAQTDSCFSYDTINICGQSSIGAGLLIQMDTNGHVQWRRTFTAATSGFVPQSIGVDEANSCYMTGYFDTTLYIGNNVLYKGHNDPLDIFIVKYDSVGNLLWLRQIYCTTSSYISAICTDRQGYSYLTGGIQGLTIFDNDTITPGEGGLFITRYTPSGTCMGVITVVNAGGMDIAEDPDGNAYVTGGIGGLSLNATFGNTTLTSSNLFGDFIVAKLSAITDSTTGVLTLLPPQDSVLQIYANPNKGLFTVVVPQSVVQATNGNLMIYDSQGSVVTNQAVDISTSHLQVDLGEITRGVYTVVLTANGKQFMGRVVIQ